MLDTELEKYVDLQDALDRVRGNRKLYKLLLQSFFKDSRKGELLGSIKRGDLVAAARDAHAIKGASANLSLTGLNAAVSDLEAQLKAGAYREDSLEACIYLFAETQKAVEELINKL